MGRRWLQFRLSTAMVIMFVAGFLLMLNVIPSDVAHRNRRTLEWVDYQVHGWPIWADRKAEPPAGKLILWTINLVVCGTIVGAAGFACELFLRRRDSD